MNAETWSPLILAVIPIIASAVANFTEIKPDDNKWVVIAKKAINIFALNFSEKAGK